MEIKHPTHLHGGKLSRSNFKINFVVSTSLSFLNYFNGK